MIRAQHLVIDRQKRPNKTVGALSFS